MFPGGDCMLCSRTCQALKQKGHLSTGESDGLHSNPRPLLSASYLNSHHTNGLAAFRLPRCRLFKLKSVGTLPLTDCKRRFISCPAAVLQSVIVIQRRRKSCHRVRVILGVDKIQPALLFFYQSTGERRSTPNLLM